MTSTMKSITILAGSSVHGMIQMGMQALCPQTCTSTASMILLSRNMPHKLIRRWSWILYIRPLLTTVTRYMSFALFQMTILGCILHEQVDAHMFKVNGMCVSGSLHMTVNKHEKIQAWTLASTKGYDQYMPSLAEIPHSLWKYGHEDTEVAFTNNL